MRHTNLVTLVFLLSGSVLPSAVLAQQPDTRPGGSQAQAPATPVQPERTPQQSDQMRSRENQKAEDTRINRDWTARDRDDERAEMMDRMRQRRMGRMMDQDEDSRTVGRNWRRDEDMDRGPRYGMRGREERYYDFRAPHRVKICVEYENGDEVCRYRD